MREEREGGKRERVCVRERERERESLRTRLTSQNCRKREGEVERA